MSGDRFYVMCIKYPPVGNCVSFWKPRACGRTTDLGQAGIYTREEIEERPDYYDNGRSTIAVPCAEVEGMAVQHVRCDSEWTKLTIEKARGRSGDKGEPDE